MLALGLSAALNAPIPATRFGRVPDVNGMFSKLLIANRGEIACRIIRTARRMGIATVAVYSDADEGALHVASADEAYRIGPAAARDSYLRIEAHLAGRPAQPAPRPMHPGYGFLSENAGFAEACAAAGLVFVGPPPPRSGRWAESEAKALMERAGVPLVPGYHGADQDPALLAARGRPHRLPRADQGQRRRRRQGHAHRARCRRFRRRPRRARSARRRRRSATTGCWWRRYLQRPRHIEIQVFADTHGNVPQPVRARLLGAAAPPEGDRGGAGARHDGRDAHGDGRGRGRGGAAVGYVGAGTVEFIAEDGRFYFMEMNTRLQVEHPVTEAITGLDLVEWQLRVAAGEKLPRTQQG